MSVSVDIIGMSELLAKLAELSAQSEVRAIAAVNAATLDAQTTAMDLSPVLTGFLRSRNLVRAIGGAHALILYELYNDAPYAPFVVFGHHTRSGSFVPPNDFFTPAMVAGRASLMKRLASIVGM